MKTKFVLASLALLAASSLASANNISIDAGVLPLSPASPYAHLFVHDASAFTDTIDFIVSSGSLGASANSLNVEFRGLPVFDIQGLSYSVWGGTSAASTVWYGTFPGNNISYDIGLNLAGAYHLVVTGVADGLNGGAYGVALVSAVPEPEMLLMLLAGLGIVGVVSRHKKPAEKAA
ncbi:FxDxF family PEP-CTERM protein [Duganella sp. S19_KUP01_CR8]|uniref:FxDxF family PEP-CTERM protein n=1 Tax=Duganella sp. S19_KUP01_CR8 TaxID=3025502 RepID=UPI002FCD8785